MSIAVEAAGPRAGSGGKFLTFFLDDEEYGLAILKVREIIRLLPITRVPRTPEAVRGVINLRGKVIPVIDLRMRFGLPEGEHTERTCIVVVQANGVEFGVVVDAVSEVVDVAAADIEEAPDLGAQVSTDFLLGIAKAQGSVKLLLDIDRVLATDDPAGVVAAAGE